MKKLVLIYLVSSIILAPLTLHAELQPRLGGKGVYDTDLGITWLADANLPLTVKFGLAGEIQPDGSMTYYNALQYIDYMNAVNWEGINQWRLPSIDSQCTSDNCGTDDEFGHLFYHELCDPDTANDVDVSDCGDPAYLALFKNSDGILTIDDGSINETTTVFYWSEDLYSTFYVWSFSFSGGLQAFRHPSFNTHFVWPVYNGDPAATSNNLDPDLDGIVNSNDNCPNVANPGQADANGNDIGDACDSSDTDHDGLTDAQEYVLETDPTNPDTDGDGVMDGSEVNCQSNPFDPESKCNRGMPWLMLLLEDE